MEHEGIVLAHEEIFKNIKEQIEWTKETLKEIWAAIEKSNQLLYDHTKDSVSRIVQMENQETRLCQLEKDIDGIHKANRWIIGICITILIAVIGSALGITAYVNRAYGSYSKQVDVNTVRLDKLEAIHPMTSGRYDDVNSQGNVPILKPLPKEAFDGTKN